MAQTPRQRIAHVVLVVADYDEALAFYVDKLHFTVVEDTYQPAQDKRWLVIAPLGTESAGGTTLLLARASSPEQVTAVGNQAAGRVFLFLETADFWRDHAAMTAAGVQFVRPQSEQPHGTVAVFVDLYGTRWDLVQFTQSRNSESFFSRTLPVEFANASPCGRPRRWRPPDLHRVAITTQ